MACRLTWQAQAPEDRDQIYDYIALELGSLENCGGALLECGSGGWVLGEMRRGLGGVRCWRLWTLGPWRIAAAPCYSAALAALRVGSSGKCGGASLECGAGDPGGWVLGAMRRGLGGSAGIGAREDQALIRESRGV